MASMREEAECWAVEYIEANEAIDSQCVYDGMNDSARNKMFDFVEECFHVGLKPIAYMDLLIDYQKTINDCAKDYMDLEREFSEYRNLRENGHDEEGV
jgi:hypothetical protein